MSSSEHAKRCRRWLEEQLELLGDLRNAHPRDPSFKLWRQNALTVLQRIWPNHPARAERFRRITFSPASSNHEPRAQREAYSRGCGEVFNYLRSLIEEIDVVGVPHQHELEGAGKPDADVGSEDDFPVVDLPSGSVPPTRSAGEPELSDEIVLDASGTRADAPEPPRTSAKEAGAPAPPTLKVDMNAPGATPSSASLPRMPAPETPNRRGTARPTGAGKSALPPAAKPAAPAPPSGPVASPPSRSMSTPPTGPVGPPPPSRSMSTPPAVPLVSPPSPPVSVNPPPPAVPSDSAAAGDEASGPPVVPILTRRTPRATRARRAAPRAKLKEMLGLHEWERPQAGPESAPTIPEAAAASPQPPAPPRAAAPSESRSMSVPPLGPHTAPPPPAARPAPPATVTAAPPLPAAASLAPPAVVTPAPPPPAAASPPPPDSGAVEPPLDPEEFARATQDFMRNSPVLGLQGRPVQRTSDSTSFMEPDAVALATLAADLARLGVPEVARPEARDRLLALARQLEAGKPVWNVLQAAISVAMEYPPLARRLVPIVLPWLDRAA